MLQHSGEATAITTGDRTGTTQTLQQRGARMTDHGEEDKSSPRPEPGYQDHTALILVLVSFFMEDSAPCGSAFWNQESQ